MERSLIGTTTRAKSQKEESERILPIIKRAKNMSKNDHSSFDSQEKSTTEKKMATGYILGYKYKIPLKIRHIGIQTD